MRFKDAEGARWSVRRVWWPFGSIAFDPGDTGVFFWIGFVLTAPLLVAWPFWLLGRFLGRPWTIVTRRKGREQSREQVAGWAAARRRMAEIAAEVQRPDGEPESRAIVH